MGMCLLSCIYVLMKIFVVIVQWASSGLEFNSRIVQKECWCIISTTPGIYLVPKLKREHVFLTNFSKMRVDLAAQVS